MNDFNNPQFDLAEFDALIGPFFKSERFKREWQEHLTKSPGDNKTSLLKPGVQNAWSKANMLK